MATVEHVLEIQNGKHKGRKVKLAAQEVIVGRGEEARIRVASSDVSREHCILMPQPNGVIVRDLGSSNGTFVDGRPITGDKLLPFGGTLTVGPLTFLLLGGKDDPARKSGDVSVSGKSAVDDSLSDDEIASWLSSDELPSTDPSPSDTTIIKNPAPEASSTVEIPTSAVKAPPRKREFKTVAEEAQDIIRRHLEMQQSQSE